MLAQNPLGDSPTRRHILLVPKSMRKECSVVFILSGFLSNGPGYFNLKQLNEPNFPQTLDNNYDKIPNAVYVFVDALSSLGGSQFLNSPAVGKFEDHIIQELVPFIESNFCNDHNLWTIMGGSSGGYGALHLASKYPLFKNVVAIAPDSFFEACYLPDLYKACPFIKKEGLVNIVKLIQKQKIQDMSVIHAVAMSACYAGDRELEFPIDLDTGQLKASVWKRWKSFDPVTFLCERKDVIKTWNSVFIECGRLDEFSLQFGAYRIWQILKDYNFKLHYEEFEGGHFDISKVRIKALQTLSNV